MNNETHKIQDLTLSYLRLTPAHRIARVFPATNVDFHRKLKQSLHKLRKVPHEIVAVVPSSAFKIIVFQSRYDKKCFFFPLNSNREGWTARTKFPENVLESNKQIFRDAVV